MSDHIVDKVQSDRAEDECPSLDHTMEDNPPLRAHYWFKAQGAMSYPSSRILAAVSWQGQNLRK